MYLPSFVAVCNPTCSLICQRPSWSPHAKAAVAQHCLGCPGKMNTSYLTSLMRLPTSKSSSDLLAYAQCSVFWAAEVDGERRRRAGASGVLAVGAAVRGTARSEAGESVSRRTGRGCLPLHPKVQSTNLLLCCCLPGEPREESTRAVHQQRWLQLSSAPAEQLAFPGEHGG